MFESYIDYLHEVLGIDSFAVANSPANIVETPSAKWQVALDSAQTTNESMDLLGKMFSAIHIDSKQIEIVQISSLRELSSASQIVFVLGSSLATSGSLGHWQNLENTRLLFSYHPQELIEKPELKRQAWEHLKSLATAIKEFL